MTTNANSSVFKSIFIVFSIILALQTLILIILMIQLSDSKAFRLAIGFCGTGISVVSIVMGMISQDENERKPIFSWLKNLNLTWLKYFWLLALIYTVINLFFVFAQNYKITHSIYEPAAYTGSLVLTTSILAFFVVGLRVLIKNPAKDAIGFIIARIVLLLFFVWMFATIYYPIFMGLLSVVSGDISFINQASNSAFNNAILRNIGNIYHWHFSAIIAFISQYRFYNKFIWVPNINKAKLKN